MQLPTLRHCKQPNELDDIKGDMTEQLLFEEHAIQTIQAVSLAVGMNDAGKAD